MINLLLTFLFILLLDLSEQRASGEMIADSKRMIFFHRYMLTNIVQVHNDMNRNEDLIFLQIFGAESYNMRLIEHDDQLMIDMAVKFNAYYFNVEHRYFGTSFPNNSMSTENLRRFLTVEQMIEDIEVFIKTMDQKNPFRNPKWVIFGGGYAGTVISLFNKIHPDSVIGTVASSAPLHFELDFSDYSRVIEFVMNVTTRPTAIASCSLFGRLTIETIVNRTKSAEGMAELSNTLHISPPLTMTSPQENIDFFLSNVFEMFQGMTENSRIGTSKETQNELTVRKMCDLLSTDQSFLNNLWMTYLWYKEHKGEMTPNHFPTDYQEMLNNYKETNTSMMFDDQVNTRGWMFLRCNGLGFFPRTDTHSIFKDIVQLKYYFKLCNDLFGMDETSVRKSNEDFIKKYETDNREFSNIVFSNGLYDPWNGLVYSKEDGKKNVKTVTISAGAHSSDLYPKYEGEPEDLPVARQQIAQFLQIIIDQGTTIRPIESTTKFSTSFSEVQGMIVVCVFAILMLL